MELAKSFEPHAVEAKWYPLWESRGMFKPTMQPGASAYCIQLPPPNVTGTLHMGHAFQQTLMDVLVRWQRMRRDADGRPVDALWQVGTDHAGIATQIVVEQQLKAEGKSRHDLGREAFVERVWSWKEESGGAITRQMRRLGASADWSRERFTMDEGLSAAVVETFVRLHEAGLIYRGKRLVNWDPKLGTAVSDLEVDSEEEQGKLWELRYPLADGSGSRSSSRRRVPRRCSATPRSPCIPEDERYRHLIGRKVRLPLADREIPIIGDDYVDREFGTGVRQDHAGARLQRLAGRAAARRCRCCRSSTWKRRSTTNAPAKYRGLDRYVARKAVLADLNALGLVVSEKPHKMVVPRCGRTGEVVEPMLTDQWFVDVSKASPAGHPHFPGRSIQELCLAAVDEQGLPGEGPAQASACSFVPAEWLSTYLHWIRNLQDWCISRQLWWGHQIPAWYDEAGNVYVARDEAAARAQARAKLGREPASLVRDPDVLDTWFSSALWCHSTLGWTGDARADAANPFLQRSCRRRCCHRLRHHLLLGRADDHDDDLVHRPHPVPRRVHQRDRARRGRAEDVEVEGQRARPDRPDRRRRHRDARRQAHREHDGPAPGGVDREAHAQAVPERHPVVRRRRLALHLREPRDLRAHAQLRPEPLRGLPQLLQQAVERVALRADERRGQGGRTRRPLAPAELSFIDRWLLGRVQQAKADIIEGLESYRFDLAAKALYEFVWDEYCDWYLELAKVQLAQAEAAGDAAAARWTRAVLVRELEATLRLAHPFMPFITEELWQTVAPLAGKSGESISLQPFPKPNPDFRFPQDDTRVALLKSIVDAVRSLRSTMGLAPGAEGRRAGDR